MTDDQIKHMVKRFLCWKLPSNFRPDAGISFKATFNEHTAHPMKHEPSGTNLFDATQADAMVRYMIEGMDAGAPDLLTALQRVVFEWGNRGETTSLEVWHNRMKPAIAEARAAIAKANP